MRPSLPGLLILGLQHVFVMYAGAIAVPLIVGAAVGPKFVADFEEISDVEERALLQRDAFERVGYLLKNLNV